MPEHLDSCGRTGRLSRNEGTESFEPFIFKGKSLRKGRNREKSLGVAKCPRLSTPSLITGLKESLRLVSLRGKFVLLHGQPPFCWGKESLLCGNKQVLVGRSLSLLPSAVASGVLSSSMKEKSYRNTFFT